ncbi:MAG: hypothetical protein ACYCYR_03645 [Desulfobulbaceae bacterium]|jgi:hypothetical protein
MGNWIDRLDNRNIETEYLTAWLKDQDVADILVICAGLHRPAD